MIATPRTLTGTVDVAPESGSRDLRVLMDGSSVAAPARIASGLALEPVVGARVFVQLVSRRLLIVGAP